MKILSWNVNGLRSCRRHGFLEWMRRERPDVVCVQETKAHRDQVEGDLKDLPGHWHSARRPGYSGVAIFSKRDPDEVHEGLGIPTIDDEGRVLTCVYGDLAVVSAYFPTCQRTRQRLPYKLDFCRAIHGYLSTLRDRGLHVVLCGDYNIAHTEIDLRNPRENRENSGFLPQERAWMDRLLASGYVDTFRRRCPNPGHYTWWSYLPGVRQRNVGWRIDYICVDEDLDARVAQAFHQPHVLGSDHCPVGIVLR